MLEFKELHIKFINSALFWYSALVLIITGSSHVKSVVCLILFLGSFFTIANSMLLVNIYRLRKLRKWPNM